MVVVYACNLALYREIHYTRLLHERCTFVNIHSTRLIDHTRLLDSLEQGSYLIQEKQTRYSIKPTQTMYQRCKLYQEPDFY